MENLKTEINQLKHKITEADRAARVATEVIDQNLSIVHQNQISYGRIIGEQTDNILAGVNGVTEGITRVIQTVDQVTQLREIAAVEHERARLNHTVTQLRRGFTTLYPDIPLRDDLPEYAERITQ